VARISLGLRLHDVRADASLQVKRLADDVDDLTEMVFADLVFVEIAHVITIGCETSFEHITEANVWPGRMQLDDEVVVVGKLSASHER
jgi:hypothetical protein